jgi:hypothetical protein
MKGEGQISRVTACEEAIATVRKVERARRVGLEENMVKLMVF